MLSNFCQFKAFIWNNHLYEYFVVTYDKNYVIVYSTRVIDEAAWYKKYEISDILASHI